jgi:nucleotide-binding universal stress UspA family protein
LTKHIEEQLRGLITALFMPVFFGMAGLTADLTVLKDPHLLLLTLGFIAIASVGKFGGAFSGGRLGGLTMRESFAVGCGMNARGSSEVIIATIGLSMGALSENLFTIIVTMAVLTTMAMPPMLRWALGRLPMSKAERERMEREEMEAKGFVSNLERLLLAVDDSANGKFASRLAGLVAGAKGMPTTVLQLPGATQKAPAVEEETAEVAETVKSAAEANQARKPKAQEAKPEPVDVTTKVSAKPANEAVASEAKKGYDLLLVGLEKTVARKKEFHPEVNLIASGFDGPLAVVDARGSHLEDPLESELDILVPISGTDVSRNAAEVAFAIARAKKTPVTVLYVAARAANGAATKKPRRSVKTRQHEEAILKDIVELADTYNVKVKTAVLGDIAPEEAILREADGGKHNLIVMGVSRRPGDKLFFGNTATAVLEKVEVSLIMVAS